MKTQTIRKAVRIFTLVIVFLIPVMESYKRILTYLPSEYVGTLWQMLSSLESAPDFFKGGHLSLLVVGLDSILGNLISDNQVLYNLLSYFGGSYWSVTIAGLTIMDPLALFQVLASLQPVSLPLIISALSPIALALILGRIFCSWLCPISTILGISHRLLNKAGLKPIKIQLVTNPNLRYLLLILGIILPFTGAIIFPYILPYALLGRLIYYLTLGTVFWMGLFAFLILIMGDIVQKGFWCNYLCPSGILLSIAGRKRLVKVIHNKEVCNSHCNLCEKTCNWNADPKLKSNFNCTNCGLCIENCPRRALNWGRKAPDSPNAY